MWEKEGRRHLEINRLIVKLVRCPHFSICTVWYDYLRACGRHNTEQTLGIHGSGKLCCADQCLGNGRWRETLLCSSRTIPAKIQTQIIASGNNKYNQHQGSQDRFPAPQPNELRPVFAGPAHNSLEMIGNCLVIQQRQAKNYCQQIEKTIVPGDNNHEL